MNPFTLLLLLSFVGIGCSNSSKASVDAMAVISETESIVSSESLMLQTDSVDIAYLLGQFEQSKDTNFARIADSHSAGSARGAYLHKEAYRAFIDMYEAAKAEGVTLTIRSATRNFNYQKGIWERKWTGKRLQGGENLAQTTADPKERALKILHTSSMPGTSRHHWGTDIDLNAFENSYFKSGKGKVEYDWLVMNASEHGFGQPYTEKGESPKRETGYEEERWHWSYLPLAKRYLAAYEKHISVDMIKGFAGDESAAPIDVITNYVSGINPECK